MYKKFSYVAVFEYAEDGINVYFPDIEEAYTFAHTTDKAFKNAKEVLELSLRGRLEDKKSIPNATDLKDIKLKQNEQASIIEVKVKTKIEYVSKNVRIPKDLEAAASKENINFSAVLTAALERELEKI